MTLTIDQVTEEKQQELTQKNECVESSEDTLKNKPRVKIQMHYLLDVKGDPNFRLPAPSAKKDGTDAIFTANGWVYQKKEDAEKIAKIWTDGKRVVVAMMWYDERANIIWKNPKSNEAKLAKKEIRNEIDLFISNTEKDKIEQACVNDGLERQYLALKELPEGMSEKHKKIHAFYKPRWDETFEKLKENELRKRDVEREKKDLEEAKKQQKSTEDSIVDELNEKHAVVHTDQFYILTEKKHSVFEGTDFTLESKQSLLNMYENQVVVCSDGKKMKSKAQIWLTHPKRRQFENGITFDPTTGSHTGGRYNIWQRIWG